MNLFGALVWTTLTYISCTGRRRASALYPWRTRMQSSRPRGSHLLSSRHGGTWKSCSPPVCTLMTVWARAHIQQSYVAGKVRSIGISNFSVKTLNELLPHCHVVPAVNQVELHPCLPSIELKKLCDDKGILLEAYSPLGTSAFPCGSITT